MNIAEKLLTIAENEQKIYDAGKKAEYDRFWDEYQQNGSRTSYQQAFAYEWSDEIYNPKYPIICTGSGASNMFSYNQKITDVTKNGRVAITVGTSTDYMFNWCKALKKAHIIVNKDTKFNYTFNNCQSLEELYVEGVIGKNGFDVSVCPLTEECLNNFLYCFEDKTADMSGTDWVVTLGATNIEKTNTGVLHDLMEKGWRYV